MDPIITSGDVALGIGDNGEVLVFSINISSIISGLVLDHCHGQEFDDVSVPGSSGTDTHPTVNIPGVYDDCAHHADGAGTCATTADGGIYDPG